MKRVKPRITLDDFKGHRKVPRHLVIKQSDGRRAIFFTNDNHITFSATLNVIARIA